jgi:hypothetical protein
MIRSAGFHTPAAFPNKTDLLSHISNWSTLFKLVNLACGFFLARIPAVGKPFLQSYSHFHTIHKTVTRSTRDLRLKEPKHICRRRKTKNFE